MTAPKKPETTEKAVEVGVFRAGRLQNYVENWREITSDSYILDIVEHCHIGFSEG